MLRYRIITDPLEGHMVVPAWNDIMPMTETYTTRQAAQDMANGFNFLAEQNRLAEHAVSCLASLTT